MKQLLTTLVLLAATAGPGLAAESPPVVSFHPLEGGLRIDIGGERFAEYRYADDQVLRPYFRHLHSPSGVQVTRNHPPRKGQDLDDHATMHPGLWMAFGDLNGADFWRNQAQVRHDGFLDEPQGGPGKGELTVRNRYEAEGKLICTERRRMTIQTDPAGRLLIWDSTFQPAGDQLVFGDQEEMGIGVRVATPLAVVKGGRIRDSEGRKNEAEVWGKQAEWCAYEGEIGQQRVGVALMPDPQNFRRCWFHARDYGLLVANPFGRNAFTRSQKSRVVVKRGEQFRLRFGVLIYDGEPDIGKAYERFCQ